MTESGERHREIVHPVLHSPNANNNEGWVRVKLRAKNSGLLSRLTGTQDLGPSSAASQVHYQEAGLEVEAGLDLNMCPASWITNPAPKVLWLLCCNELFCFVLCMVSERLNWCQLDI